MTYRVDNLDVYRRAVAAGAALYRTVEESSGSVPVILAESLQRAAIEMVANLTGGLGFWERERKTPLFYAAKRAALAALGLYEVVSLLAEVPAERRAQLAGELHDLAKMINGLLRGQRRQENGAGERQKEAVAARERSPVYH